MSMFLGMSVGPLLGGVFNNRFSFNAAFVYMSSLTMIGFLLSITLIIFEIILNYSNRQEIKLSIMVNVAYVNTGP